MTTSPLNSPVDLPFPFQVEHQKPLHELSTFKIGGPARYYTEVDTIPQMQQVLRFCRDHHLRYLVIGKGSNCLFDERGFEGLIVSARITFLENPEPHLFHVGAGFSFSRLGALTARQGWTGLEFASGIPCSVGGAVFMNAGANGRETVDALVSVDFVDDHGQWQVLRKEDLQFRYRHSSFQGRSGAIVGALFSLSPDGKARESQLTIINYRMKTQPYHEPSAGCVFRNPDPSLSTLSAGALIEKAGLKGLSVGGARVSEMHANFIVNSGGATARDVLELMNKVRERVFQFAHVDLEPEIRTIPYDLPERCGGI